MNKKVLGFYAKDERLSKGKGYWAMFPKKKQVPVVSLQELKKKLDYLKDFAQQISENKDLFLEKALNPADVDGLWESIDQLPELINDLLSLAEAQSVRKPKKETKQK